MRWTRECRARRGVAGRGYIRERSAARRTSDAIVDGEVVWSWRPDAGVKACGCRVEPDRALMRDDPQDDGGKTARSPGRSRISRKAIAQGRPDDLACTCGSAACILLHANRGCGGHPAFPAPLCLAEGHVCSQLGRHAPRDRGSSRVSPTAHARCLRIVAMRCYFLSRHSERTIRCVCRRGWRVKHAGIWTGTA
jgi:hypothetical protein